MKVIGMFVIWITSLVALAFVPTVSMLVVSTVAGWLYVATWCITLRQENRIECSGKNGPPR